jgi:TldD protein
MSEKLEEHLLKVEGSGVQYAELRYHKTFSSQITTLNGILISNEQDSSSGYSLRTYRGGQMEFYSRDSSPPELESTPVGRSWEEGIDLEGGEGKISFSSSEKIRPSDVSLEEKLSLLREIKEEAFALRLSTKLERLVLSYWEGVEEKESLNSLGLRMTSRISRIGIWYSFTLKDGDKYVTASLEEFGGSGGFELLKGWNVKERILDRISSLDSVVTKGKAPSPGRKDVIVSGMIAGIIAHESGGHPFEADRVLGREAAQAGKSYLSQEWISKKMGSDTVTLVDDPTLEGSMGFFQVDDEGVKARRKFLIREGKVEEMLHSRLTAPRWGVRSNGSTRAMDYESEPLIRMSNTFFLPGKAKFQDLLDGIRNGVFLKSYMEWNIDDLRWGQRYVGLEAYEVKDGEIGEPVKFPVLESTTGEIYSSIDMVDDSLTFYPGTCGKGEPSQGVPVWFGGPNMRIRNVTIKVMAQ